MTSAKDIARYIISYFSSLKENDLTNLKLQKLLYYVQVEHIRIYGSKAFPERIEVWECGPVVPDVYEIYK